MCQVSNKIRTTSVLIDYKCKINQNACMINSTDCNLAQLLHCEDKTNKCVLKYMNLLSYIPYKPRTCFGDLLQPSQVVFFF